MTRTHIIDPFLASTGRKFLFFCLYPLVWVLTRSPEMGAQVILHCCLADEVKGGSYYSNCYEKPSKGQDDISNDLPSWNKLWHVTEQSLREYLND